MPENSQIPSGERQDRSGLTEQEFRISRTAEFDFGAGYPQVPTPEYIKSVVIREPILGASVAAADRYLYQEQNRVSHALEDSVRDFLSIRSSVARIFPTFSGSVAIERAIMAVLNRARRDQHTGLEVITTSPSIDIVPIMLREHVDINVQFVECLQGADFPSVAVDEFLQCIQRPHSIGTTRAVFIASPENPTGYVWTADSLRAVVDICRSEGYSLIVDHAFILCGVQTKPVPALWDVFQEADYAIGIWDTSKTFGLNGDKLGFVIATQAMSSFIEESLRVLQFDISLRSKLMFRDILSAAASNEYVSWFNALCLRNFSSLKRLEEHSQIRVLDTPAGTLALLDVSGLGLSDIEAHHRLLQEKLGVITGRTFFHGSTQPGGILRVALAREPVVFDEALTILRTFSESIISGSE